MEQLFGSKTRVKLLSLFLNNPGRPYYVREITRKIDEQINSVRRELSNLLAIGIVKSDNQNNRLYYEANQQFRYYAPLRAIFTNVADEQPDLENTKEDDETAKKLKGSGNVQLAFLTGTFVRDNSAGTDLFVMGDVNRARIAKIVSELEAEQGRELNYTVMTPDEYNYRLNLNDRFLSSVLEAKKIMLVDFVDREPAASVPARLKEDPVQVAVAVEVDGDK